MRMDVCKQGYVQTTPNLPGFKLTNGAYARKEVVLGLIIGVAFISLYASFQLVSSNSHLLVLVAALPRERAWLSQQRTASQELTKKGANLQKRVRLVLEQVKTHTNTKPTFPTAGIKDTNVKSAPIVIPIKQATGKQTKSNFESLFPEFMEKMEFTKEHINLEQWGKHFAVFSSHTPADTDYNYPFFLPVTTKMWRRVGYESIVIIAGTKHEWEMRPVLNHILSELIIQDAIVIFLHSPPKYSVILSQVARLAVTQLLNWNDTKKNDVTIVTSDADIWPITKDYFEVQLGTKILSLRSDCCGNFTHRNKTFKMLPIGHLLMSVQTWQEVMTGHLGNARQIMAHLVEEFGLSALNASSRGNSQWFMDQKLVSMRIAQWIAKHGSDDVDFMPGDNWDRVDRAKWDLPKDDMEMSYLIDSHVFTHAYRRRKWRRAKTLLWLLLRDRSDMTELQIYRNGFIHLLNAEKNATKSAHGISANVQKPLQATA